MDGDTGASCPGAATTTGAAGWATDGETTSTANAVRSSSVSRTGRKALGKYMIGPLVVGMFRRSRRTRGIWANRMPAGAALASVTIGLPEEQGRAGYPSRPRL